MGRHLGIHFLRFSWILGAKLGWKMESRSIQEGIGKTMKKKKGTKMAKKFVQDAATSRWEGSRVQGTHPFMAGKSFIPPRCHSAWGPLAPDLT